MIWKDDPQRIYKELCLEILIPALYKFAREEALRISLQEMIDFIDEWAKYTKIEIKDLPNDTK